jgi:hypothetical protein
MSYFSKRLMFLNINIFDSLCTYIFVWVIKSRRIRWAGHVTRMREARGMYRVLVGKPEGKRPLGRPWRRWEDNIKMTVSIPIGVVF